MHLFHISQCSIQNRNVHISVLNGALWDMEQVHSGICELGQHWSITTQVHCGWILFHLHWHQFDINFITDCTKNCDFMQMWPTWLHYHFSVCSNHSVVWHDISLKRKCCNFDKIFVIASDEMKISSKCQHFCFSVMHDEMPPRHLTQYTVECHYNSAQYNMMMHTSQQ